MYINIVNGYLTLEVPHNLPEIHDLPWLVIIHDGAQVLVPCTTSMYSFHRPYIYMAYLMVFIYWLLTSRIRFKIRHFLNLVCLQNVMPVQPSVYSKVPFANTPKELSPTPCGGWSLWVKASDKHPKLSNLGEVNQFRSTGWVRCGWYLKCQ